MLEKRGGEWGDRVRLIGLSIDQDFNKLVSHIEDKNWKKVEHYHVRNGKCTADQEYGVQGVPHVLLVDTNGTIVFMGHPSSRKLEEDIDALLACKTLEGNGTQPAGGSSANDDGKFATDEEVEKFQKGTAEWVEGMKTTSEGCQRAFLVMTVD